YWAVVAYRTAVPSSHWDRDLTAEFESWSPAPPYFAQVFRVPAVLADAAACYVLYRFWRGRAGPTRAATVAAAFAWSPCAVLVGAYHTNTDSVLALMILLAAVAATADPATGRRPRPFLAGLALAGAINVKLTPVLLVPVLLLACRRWRDAAWAVGGLAAGALPFVPLLATCWAKFYAQSVGYRSNPDSWGVLYLLMRLTGTVPDDPQDVTVGPSPVVRWYYERGRFVVLAAVVAWAAAGRRLSAAGRAGPADLFAVAAALFLILAPGFGIQYTVTVLPVMFASRPRWAAAYGLVAGAFALLLYAHHWTGTWPAYSQFRGRMPAPIPYVGLAAWALLVGYVVAVVTDRRTKAFAALAGARHGNP
ncbi:MAG TPA: glycosyltransferase 87 family protein, partial [Humisphaera sp.]